MHPGTEKQFEDLDNELIAAGVPLRYRPLDCFKKLYGSVPDGPQRDELFAPLISWYLKKYGDAVRWDGIVARFPVLIRGVVYLGQARFVGAGEVLANFQEGIEQLPDEVVRSLSPEEKRPILEKLTFGARGFASLHNLIIDDLWLSETEQALVRRALYDLENAAVTLKHTGDTQAASVQAHEAAEKFLKAALSRAGSSKALKSFGHNIPKLFRELLVAEPRYACVELPVENLQKLAPNMELRYSHVPRSLEMAVAGFHGSLYVCEFWPRCGFSIKREAAQNLPSRNAPSISTDRTPRITARKPPPTQQFLRIFVRASTPAPRWPTSFWHLQVVLSILQ